MENEIKTNFECLVKLLLDYNDGLRRMGKKPCFHPTDNTLKIVLNIENPDSENKFATFIGQLYKIMYESARYGNNLPNDSELTAIIEDVVQLRHEYGHDRLVGNESQVIKKQLKVGEIISKYMGKRTLKSDDFVILSNELLLNLIDVMKNVVENISETEKEFTHTKFVNITYDPIKRKNLMQRKTIKKGSFAHLSVTPIFVPNAFWIPEIRSERDCVYIPMDMWLKDQTIEGVKKLITVIHNFWENSLNDVMYTRPLLSWSISDTSNNLIYGFGKNSLFKNLKNLSRSVLTVVLSGEYGKGLSDSLVVFGTDFRNNRVDDFFVDFYLSSIPLETNWLESFRTELHKAANNISGGDSCQFLKTNFKRWQSPFLDLPISSIHTLIGKNESDFDSYYDNGIISMNLVSSWELETNWGDVSNDYNPFDCLDDLVGFLNPALFDDDYTKNELRVRRVTLSQFLLPGRGGTIPIILGKIAF